MARFEGEFRPANGKALELDELLELLEKNSSSAQPIRDNARACYLSSSEGWRDAARQLGGAFADESGPLRETQGE